MECVWAFCEIFAKVYPIIFLKKFKNATQIFLWMFIINAYCVCQYSPSSSSPRPFRNIGEFGAKKYYTDHRTANTIQLFVVVKGSFSVPFFFWTSRSEKEFRTYYLINVAISLNLTLEFLLNLGFVFSSLTFTIKKANACSTWTACCVCLKSITLRNCLSSSSFLHHFSRITLNSEQKNILQIFGQLI